MKFNCAIFDLDGTITDSQLLWTRCKLEVLDEHRIPRTPALELRIKSMELPEIAHAVVQEFRSGGGMTEQQILAKALERMRYYYSTAVPLKPGVEQLLRRLREKGVARCVATGSLEDLFMPMLQRLGVVELFDHIVTCRQVGRDKRFADVYLEAARRSGSDPAHAVVFEDTGYSAQAAKEAGFRVVGINEPSSEGSPERMRRLCDWYVDTVDQLPEDFWAD